MLAGGRGPHVLLEGGVYGHVGLVISLNLGFRFLRFRRTCRWATFVVLAARCSELRLYDIFHLATMISCLSSRVTHRNTLRPVWMRSFRRSRPGPISFPVMRS